MLEAGDDVVRMSPPLIVDSDEVDTAVRIFGEAVAEVAADPSGFEQARGWGATAEVAVDRRDRAPSRTRMT